MYYNDLNGDQRRTYIDTVQTHTAYREACEEFSAFRGSMHWYKVKGRDYLYHKLTQKNRKALGPRSAETEAHYQEFTQAKVAAAERLAALADRLQAQGKLARAVRIDRVPPIAAKVLQAINDEPELRDQIMVVGTHALWAYEALAGVQFETEVTATRDVDIMWDVRKHIELVGPLAAKGLVGFLQGIDKSFKRDRQKRFRAINKDAYAVDLLAPNRRGDRELRLVTGKDDLVAQRIDALNELLDDPVEQVVIGHLGHIITTMRVPEPRAFVRHKVWLSARTDRETEKRRRDLMMAEAVARLIVEHLPQFPLAAEDIQGFPEAVRRALETA